MAVVHRSSGFYDYTGMGLLAHIQASSTGGKEVSNNVSNHNNNNGKFHVSKKTPSWKRPELYYPAMIPEPDYSDSEEENSQNSSSRKQRSSRKAERGQQQQQFHKLNLKNNSSNMTTTAGTNGNPVQLTEDGLVIPKKLGNPCLTSQERQNLHKELMFNQKIGKSVLGQKSELQKVMEKIRDEQKKKEIEGEKLNKRSSFEKRLEEQASKIKTLEGDTNNTKKPEEVDQPEFLRVHARVRANTFPVDTES